MDISSRMKNFMKCMDVQVYGNEHEVDRHLHQIKNHPDQEYYLSLKSELKKILDDNQFDYLHFLENDEYEFGLYGVDVPENQYQAKKFIIDYIWNKLYPDDRIDI